MNEEAAERAYPEAVVPPCAMALQAYVAEQTAGFHSFIHHAVKAYRETGSLPAAVFADSGKLLLVGKVKPKAKAVGARRQMSAFNFFVQKRMAEFKEQGVKPPEGAGRNPLFIQAVGEWKALPDSDRDAFVAEFKESHPAIVEDVAVAGAGGETGAMPTPTKALASTLVNAVKGSKKEKHKQKEKSSKQEKLQEKHHRLPEDKEKSTKKHKKEKRKDEASGSEAKAAKRERLANGTMELSTPRVAKKSNK